MGSDAKIARRLHLALDVPLLRFLGVVAVDDSDPAAGIELTQTPKVLNAVDALHGGTIATVLDVAAYLALLPQLADDEEAVTHMVSLSYLARPDAGVQLKATGEVLRRGRRLAFVTSALRCGDLLLATASVTKSIFTTAGS